MVTPRSSFGFLELALVAGLIGGGLPGCGGAEGRRASASETTVAALVVPSVAGRYTASVRTDPSPPIRGVNRVFLEIRDASGAPKDGLTLTAVSWMPAHGHGASVKPTITALGNGTYVAENVVFFMAGRWELRTTIVGDGDQIIPAFDIP